MLYSVTHQFNYIIIFQFDEIVYAFYHNFFLFSHHYYLMQTNYASSFSSVRNTNSKPSQQWNSQLPRNLPFLVGISVYNLC